MLISDPYVRIGCYYPLDLTAAAHWYHYIPFLDNEDGRMHCFFTSLCLYQEVRSCICCLHLTE